jgi:putative FmdB family regulatory protein
MALYQYHCPACQATFEKFVSAEKRDEDQVCPNGHPGGERLLQSYAITFEDRRKSFRRSMRRMEGKHFT